MATVATFTLLAAPEPADGGREEPITWGFAFARGALAGDVVLVGPGGPVPVQARPLLRWPDGSVKWLLCDFVAGAGGPWRLGRGEAGLGRLTPPEPFAFGATLHLRTSGGAHVPVVERTWTEAEGPVRATVRAEGALGPLRLLVRTSRWAGRPEVRLELTLRNPRAASHPGGTWDLGDPASVHVVDLSLRLAAPGPVSWRATPDEPFAPADALHLFQASSGGERWNCVNHANGAGVVPLAFCGWRSGTREGLRATPEVQAGSLRVTVPRFWQEFPKVLAASDGALRVGLWPEEHGEPHELQPGEQKTFVVWLSDGTDALDFVHAPRRPLQTPAEVAAVVAHLGLPEDDDPAYAARLDLMIDPARGFAARREDIDEYGWRHFGDLYADHEAVKNPSHEAEPFVSHYNNQYDCVDAFLQMYLRSGDPRWWELAEPLARHVVDVDLYHTDQDRACYNGGLFWHTDHYQPARTATHRCWSRKNGGKGYGGGHSNEHDYPSGLLLYHCLTGDPHAAEAVLSLATWVRDMDDGTKSVFGLLDDGPTGLATCTYTLDYQGPGRGAGNSVNACCDAFALTGDRAWIGLAETFIRRVVHPRQPLETLELLDAERRWSYVVFLKYLCKYLELKDELGERDAMYAYARDTLVRYATWMVAHERPSTSVPEKLEHVTETWPAQDLRKAQVVEMAAAYVDAGTRAAWRGWADATFARAFRELTSFATHDCTRPLVLSIHPGVARAWARRHPDHEVPPHEHDHDFGAHAPFIPQKMRVKARLRTPGGLLRLAFLLLRPSTWRRLCRPW